MSVSEEFKLPRGAEIPLVMTDYKRNTKNISLAIHPLEFSRTPPSLYLYHKDNEWYKRFEGNMTHQAEIDNLKLKFYLYQWADEDEAGKYNASFHVELAS